MPLNYLCCSNGNLMLHPFAVADYLRARGLPHGTKPPPHVPVQTIYNIKPSSRAIASVSPGIHQSSQHGSSSSHPNYENSSSSSALNATRTSSFAAALRKLAKQAVDPIAERERSPICSPVPNQHSASSKSSNSSSAAYSSLNPATSVPVVTIPSSHGPYELDKRKEYIRYSSSVISNNSRGSEPVSFKPDYPKHINNHEEHRSDNSFEGKPTPSYTSLSQYSSRDEHNSLSQGFQPYRSTEESSASASAYEQSPSSSSSIYPYHRPVFQINNASQNYRPRSDERFSENDLLRVREAQDHGHGMFQSRDRSSRDLESSDVADDKVRRIYSPLSLQIASNRTESPINVSSRMESVSYSSSHDILLRKHSPPNSSSAPLNLVKHTPSASPFPEEMGKWKIKQHYAANGQGYSSSGSAHGRNSYESLEQKFHPPPPLISEAQQDLPIHRNLLKVEEPGGRNVLAYSKAASTYTSREYQRVPEDSLYHRTAPNSHQNGALLSRETYDNHTLFHADKIHREYPDHIATNDPVKNKPQMRNGTVPMQDPWPPRNYYPAERLDQNEEITKNSVAPSNPLFTLSDVPASHFNLKDASITRALLQNHITPSIIEQYVHASEELMPKVVSKLDRREAKLRQLRITTGDSDRELTDSESDDDGGLKLKEFLVITKGPPLECKVSPQKIGFFKTVGLTTQPKKQFLEWRKYMKRRKILREKSCSPIVEVVSDRTQYDQNHLAELSKRLCIEDDSETKKEFLKLLGLIKVSHVKSEPASEVADSTQQPEAQRAPPSQPPAEKPLEEVPETHYKKRFSLLTRMHMESLNKTAAPNQVVVNGTGVGQSAGSTAASAIPNLKTADPSPFFKGIPKLTSASIPPLIRTEQTSPYLDKMQSSGKSLLSQDPRAKFLDRSFAQEFHESVLQATQMQLGHRAIPESLPSRVPHSLDVAQAIDENSKLAFIWPGIEAVMEAYETHLSELSVEKDFLTERLQYLTCRNQELMSQITCLGEKTSELAHKKSCLDTENASIQVTIENFKSLFLKFR